MWNSFILFVLLFQTIVFAKSPFMQMCENPTPSQRVTLKAMAENAENAKSASEVLYQLEENLYRNGHKSVDRKGLIRHINGEDKEVELI